MQHFTFRLAQNDDLPAIVDIWRENIVNEYSISPQVLQRCTTTLTDLFLARNCYCNFWVAASEESGQIIGWNSFVAILPTILKKDSSVEISTYIHFDYQRLGIAFALMSYCLAELMNSEISSVYGFANESKLKIHKILVNLGFERCGKLPATGEFPFNETKLLYIYQTGKWKNNLMSSNGGGVILLCGWLNWPTYPPSNTYSTAIYTQT